MKFIFVVVLFYHLHGNNGFQISQSRAPLLSMSLADEERPLTLPERISRTILFTSKAVPLFASYKLLEESIKFQKTVLGREITEEAEQILWESIHDWGSDVISDAINELKGFYVKTGQIISTRVDIFPKQYISKLAMMQVKLVSILRYFIPPVTILSTVGCCRPTTSECGKGCHKARTCSRGRRYIGSV